MKISLLRLWIRPNATFDLSYSLLLDPHRRAGEISTYANCQARLIGIKMSMRTPWHIMARSSTEEKLGSLYARTATSLGRV